MRLRFLCMACVGANTSYYPARRFEDQGTESRAFIAHKRNWKTAPRINVVPRFFSLRLWETRGHWIARFAFTIVVRRLIAPVNTDGI